MFVVPETPNGMPAMMTSESPALTNPSPSAVRHALSTISSTRSMSSLSTECTPHTRASRRAVLVCGVRLRIGALGRSRAARKLLDPDFVYVTAAGIERVCTMRCIASEIASASVACGGRFVASICSR